MNKRTRSRDGVWGAIALGQILSLVLLAGCLWWVAREVAYVFASHRILASVNGEQGLGPVVTRELALFAGAAWLVHAFLGALAAGLALLTEKAFPNGIGARRSWLVAGWFMALAGLVLAANTTLYPSSVFSGEDSWWRKPVMGFLPVEFACVAFTALLSWLLIRVAPRLVLPRLAQTIATTAAAIAAIAFLISPRLLGAASTPVASAVPNIVILGIDSLRNDLQVPHRGAAKIPNVHEFLSGAVRFTDATTPLARTYPSWVSILTGRHPVATNARYNLMARASVHEGETLGDALRAHGFRAIYATDEVRFANIDRSFGFDQVITPPVGAVDFMLGYAGDIPLVNLVAPTRAGGWLFPSNHANRAAAITYRPQQFLDRLNREISIEGPSFLAIHLTLAHWPYAWAGMELPSAPEEYRDAYAVAVEEVDRQFRSVLQILRDKHVLDNAIVVVLSDHGEALGADDDSMLRKIGTGTEIWDSLWGHGTSVMSPNQYHTLLAMRAFGQAALPCLPGNRDWPVSLEDLRPTLEELATGRAPHGVDGRSLLPYLAGHKDSGELAARVRFTETDFNTPQTLAGHYNASGVLNEAAAYYELDRESGWAQLRAETLPELFARKQRAAFSAHTLLAAVPGAPGQPLRYLLTDRNVPDPRVLEAPPDASLDSEARRLWDALQARYPGELPPFGDPPRM